MTIPDVGAIQKLMCLTPTPKSVLSGNKLTTKRSVDHLFKVDQRVIIQFPSSPTRRTGTVDEVKPNAVGIWVTWDTPRQGKFRDWVNPKETIVFSESAPARTLIPIDEIRKNYPVGKKLLAQYYNGNYYPAEVILSRTTSPPLKVKFTGPILTNQIYVGLDQVKDFDHREEKNIPMAVGHGEQEQEPVTDPYDTGEPTGTCRQCGGEFTIEPPSIIENFESDYLRNGRTFYGNLYCMPECQACYEDPRHVADLGHAPPGLPLDL